MANMIPFSQSHTLFKKSYFAITPLSNANSKFIPSDFARIKSQCCKLPPKMAGPRRNRNVVVWAIAVDNYPGETKGFVEEMRYVAMKFHSTEQSKEGEQEVKDPIDHSLEKWNVSIDGYLKFLVNSKLVHDTLEEIIEKAVFPYYADFRNSGLERSEKLVKDLQWFKEQGYTIPEPSSSGITYSKYLKELSEQDYRGFICHYYNIYFAHAAGGRMIGKKVAEKILEEEELEFYKWDGDVSQLIQNVKDKLNDVAERWTREEKNHCLKETENAFKHMRKILRLILV